MNFFRKAIALGIGMVMASEEDRQTAQDRFPCEIRWADTYSPAERMELAGGETDPSGTASYHLQWRPTEKHVFGFDAGKMVCHVGLLQHTVAIQERPVSVAGIGGVLVRKECRGRDYARAAIRHAESFAFNEIGVQFIVLFCRPALQGWYRQLGWKQISSPVWIEQAQGSILMPTVSMVKCRGQEQWPQGEVQLGSRPW